MIDSRFFARWSRAVAAVQCVVLCLRHRNSSPGFDAWVDLADEVCVLLLVAEVALRAVGYCVVASSVAHRPMTIRGGDGGGGGGDPRWLHSTPSPVAGAASSSAATSSLVCGFMPTHGFDTVVAVVSMATLLPPVPVHVRRVLAPVRILRLLSTSPAQREIVVTFARCGEVIAVLLG